MNFLKIKQNREYWSPFDREGFSIYMKLFTLKRIADTENGTFGVLFDESEPFAVTVERRWLNNKKGESCIPNGEYVCKRIQSPKFGDTFEVTNVNGRDAILFHKGNLQDDSHGCILVGENFARLNGKTSIAASGEGFAEFKDRLKDQNDFKLII